MADDGPTIAEASAWSVKGVSIADMTHEQTARHLIDACMALAAIQATAERIRDDRARGEDAQTTARIKAIVARAVDFGAG